MENPKISVAAGVALWIAAGFSRATSILAGIDAQQVASSIYTLATAVAGAILVFRPVYTSWRQTRRDEYLKDKQAGMDSAAAKVDSLIQVCKDQKDEIESLNKELARWQELALAKKADSGQAQPPK